LGARRSRYRDACRVLQTLLERIVDERVGQTKVGTVSAAIDKLAEEIAREALSDDTFRRAIRELVQARSQELLVRLLPNGVGERAKSRRKPPRRSRSSAAKSRARPS
jgi:non-homologous end joining protein Ku